jgi:hypothetical protein
LATQTDSVVTPERYAQGLSYQQWMEQIDRNQQRFIDNYDEMKLSDAEVSAFKALMAKANGPAKCLALGEAWCTDVVRGLPVMQRLVEATGLDMKIFFRDQHLDIMNEFLYKGEFQSIPVFVFYTKDHEYLGHWIEKAKLVREQTDEHLTPLTSRMRNPELTEEERARFTAEYADFQHGPIWDGWRHAQIAEITALLEQATK